MKYLKDVGIKLAGACLIAIALIALDQLAVLNEHPEMPSPQDLGYRWEETKRGRTVWYDYSGNIVSRETITERQLKALEAKSNAQMNKVKNRGKWQITLLIIAGISLIVNASISLVVNASRSLIVNRKLPND